MSYALLLLLPTLDDDSSGDVQDLENVTESQWFVALGVQES